MAHLVSNIKFGQFIIAKKCKILDEYLEYVKYEDWSSVHLISNANFGQFTINKCKILDEYLEYSTYEEQFQMDAWKCICMLNTLEYCKTYYKLRFHKENNNENKKMERCL